MKQGARELVFRDAREGLLPGELGEIYGRMAERYERNALASPIQRRITEHLVEHIGARLPHGARLVEIGCGPGTLAIELARRGCRVIAADISVAMLEHVKRRAREAGVDVPVQWVDATKDMSSLGTFDALLTVNGPLTFNPGARAMIRRFAERVRPGGQMWLALPRAASLRQIVQHPRRALVPLALPWLEHGEGALLSGHGYQAFLRDPVQLAESLADLFAEHEVVATGLIHRGPRWIDRRLGRTPLLRRLGSFSVIYGRRVEEELHRGDRVARSSGNGFSAGSSS